MLLSDQTSTKSSKQRSLDVVFSFANAPPVISQSDLARGLSALMRLTIGEIPNLISEDEQRDSWASMSIEEVILVLSDEWELRQTKNEAAERAWANDLEVGGGNHLFSGLQLISLYLDDCPSVPDFGRHFATQSVESRGMVVLLFSLFRFAAPPF